MDEQKNLLCVSLSTTWNSSAHTRMQIWIDHSGIFLLLWTNRDDVWNIVLLIWAQSKLEKASQ